MPCEIVESLSEGDPMSARRKSMRQVREVLRLKHACGRSLREAGERPSACRLRTAMEYVRRAEVGGP